MSAYVVEDSTINKVITFFEHFTESKWYYIRLRDAGYDIYTQEGREKLGQAMFDLNVRAVNALYGEGQAGEFRPLDFEYRYEMAGNRTFSYKALEAWLYQCSEGDVPNDPLYKLMSDLACALAKDIVSDTISYKSAPWG